MKYQQLLSVINPHHLMDVLTADPRLASLTKNNPLNAVKAAYDWLYTAFTMLESRTLEYEELYPFWRDEGTLVETGNVIRQSDEYPDALYQFPFFVQEALEEVLGTDSPAYRRFWHVFSRKDGLALKESDVRRIVLVLSDDDEEDRIFEITERVWKLYRMPDDGLPTVQRVTTYTPGGAKVVIGRTPAKRVLVVDGSERAGNSVTFVTFYTS